MTDAKRSRLLPRTVSSKTVSVGCRTNTSNAVVIFSKGKIPDQDSNHHQAEHLHGFLEEDEHEERKAALSSSIKGRKRLSSAVKVYTCLFQPFSDQFHTRLLSKLKMQHHHQPSMSQQAVRRNSQMRTSPPVVKTMVHGATFLSLPICNT